LTRNDENASRIINDGQSSIRAHNVAAGHPTATRVAAASSTSYYYYYFTPIKETFVVVVVVVEVSLSFSR
jgi:hypothetical protein